MQVSCTCEVFFWPHPGCLLSQCKVNLSERNGYLSVGKYPPALQSNWPAEERLNPSLTLEFSPEAVLAVPPLTDAVKDMPNTVSQQGGIVKPGDGQLD